MSEYTKGPWGLLNVPRTNPRYRMKLGPLLVQKGSDADILRAHACVNALEGIANPAAIGEVVEALLAVVNATRAYLPPDGISEKECIERILEATDNQQISRVILEIENGRA